ncbi:MAG: CPBP family intramembrane metalloprotease [Gaiellales bacterium]|nr:MAG: CPBP family intramembrane metalloprotease [Gaiellales bacterium]
MSPEEIITTAVLVAVLALSAYFLLVRDARGTPPGLPRHQGEYTASRPLLLVDRDGHPLPQWGALDTLAVVLIVVVGAFAAQVAAFVVLGVATAIVDPGFDIETWLDTPTGVSSFHVIFWAVEVGGPLLYLRARGYAFDRFTFGFRPTRFGYALGIWIATMFGCYLVIPATYTSLVEAYELFELPRQEVVEPFGLTWGGFVIALITVAIATPFVEEFLFRGVIHRGLEKRLGFFLAAIASSTIFALAHLPHWGLMPILFSIGFGFALMLRVTGSLWLPIAGHFVVNTVAVIVNFRELF